MRAQSLGEVAKRHGIQLLLQFGSTVTGQTHVDSDLDLAALFDKVPASFLDLGDVVADLQALFPGREVDLAILNHADPLLLRTTTDRAVLLYGTTRRFAEFRMHAFTRYQDHRRFLQLEREYVRRQAARA